MTKTQSRCWCAGGSGCCFPRPAAAPPPSLLPSLPGSVSGHLSAPAPLGALSAELPGPAGTSHRVPNACRHPPALPGPSPAPAQPAPRCPSLNPALGFTRGVLLVVGSPEEEPEVPGQAGAALRGCGSSAGLWGGERRARSPSPPPPPSAGSRSGFAQRGIDPRNVSLFPPCTETPR